MHKLTVADVKAAKTAGAPRKLVDGGGLYLLLSARGSKYWRYDYRFAGKRKTLALGVFPEVSLAEARKSHFLARESLREGADPGETKKIQKKENAGPSGSMSIRKLPSYTPGSILHFARFGIWLLSYLDRPNAE